MVPTKHEQSHQTTEKYRLDAHSQSVQADVPEYPGVALTPVGTATKKLSMQDRIIAAFVLPTLIEAMSSTSYNVK